MGWLLWLTSGLAVGFLAGIVFVAYLPELAGWWDRVRDKLSR